MENHIKNFFCQMQQATEKVSLGELIKAIEYLKKARQEGSRVYLIGNGGSSAIASHFAGDLNKTILGHKGDRQVKRFQAVSLCDNTPVITAWANDVGFEKIFAEQLKNLGKANDVLIAISSSGNSANIIEAVKTAKGLSMSVVGFAGFDGGKLVQLSDAKIHIPFFDYGIVESLHDAICHLITSYFEKNIS